MSEQRLDKWLWCARLTKTRSGAARAIAEGKVRINCERALKPSRLLREGDVVTSVASGRLFVVRVLAWATRRGSASLARTLYEDLTPQAAPSPEPRLAAKGPRPTKRDRRRLDAIRIASSKLFGSKI
jgi:ribosome-associated heat shock protein Hsp15